MFRFLCILDILDIPTPRNQTVRGFCLAYLQAKDSLHGDEEGRNVESLEENLCSLLPVLAGVEGSFGEQHRMLWRKDEGQLLAFLGDNLSSV